MSDGHVASLLFAVKVSEKETCKVQADSAHMMDNGSVKFVIHNDCKLTVAVFKEFKYFFIERANK